MAKSLRSKWKRKMKAVKRVRYGQKENDRLVKMIDAAKVEKESQQQEVIAVDEVAENDVDKMEMDGKTTDFSTKTLKNKHGTFPVWVPNRKIKRLSAKGTKLGQTPRRKKGSKKKF